MPSKKKLTYKDSGVDIDLGDDLADKYVSLMQSTYSPQVLRNDGGFGGLYRLKGLSGLFARKFTDPVLVSGTDGVGTKLKIAFAMNKHDTVGIDLVAMSVNDVLVQGAEPLFFLDYVGAGKLDKKVTLDVVKGVAEGCRQAGCALLGGETAELPGFYQEGEYDLAGFAVGIAEKKDLIDGKAIEEGDIILGLASSGLHSNGYSLARKALLEAGKLPLTKYIPELGKTIGEELLTPTRIYVKPIINVLRTYKKKRPVHGLVHITGGGIVGNVPRIVKSPFDAEIKLGSWNVPPIFNLIKEIGNVADEEMFRVFNMGIGMIMVVSEASARSINKRLKKLDVNAMIIGRIVKGNGAVKFV